MAQNFLPVDRDQLYLMPPSVRDWLPEDHFAWFILDMVDELDLSSFLVAYREDGRGRAAYHPAVLGSGTALCLLHRRALELADRAPLPRGRRLPRRGRQPDARPRHRRALPPAAPRCPRRLVCPSAATV